METSKRENTFEDLQDKGVRLENLIDKRDSRWAHPLVRELYPPQGESMSYYYDPSVPVEEKREKVAKAAEMTKQMIYGEDGVGQDDAWKI